VKKLSTTILSSSLGRTGDKLLSRLDQSSKLREIANKKSYPYKVNQVHKKILEEYNFWTSKSLTSTSPFKLADLRKDLMFIESQLDINNLDKSRIDILAEKYNISYAENNSRTKP